MKRDPFAELLESLKQAKAIISFPNRKWRACAGRHRHALFQAQ
jgi:hypothetical protein